MSSGLGVHGVRGRAVAVAVLAAAVAVAPGLQSPSSASGNFRQISGYVFSDVDRDGTFDDGENSIPSQVELRDRAGTVVARHRSDPFIFRDLPAGDYTMAVDPATVAEDFAVPAPLAVTVAADEEIFDAHIAVVTDRYRTGRYGASGDPVVAAVDISQRSWEPREVSRVVIARADDFADALAGVPLTARKGPLLLTRSTDGRVEPHVVAEIERILDRGDCTTGLVYLLGGEAAIPASVQTQLEAAGFCVRRVAGADRTETSVKVAELVTAGTTGGQVLLARADDWPDAITASAAGLYERQPVLVTWQDRLSPTVDAFLARFRPSKIRLVGGPVALSEAVKTAAAKRGTTVRVAGAARDATAVEVARQVWTDSTRNGVTLVNGYAANAWAYALPAAALAGRDHAAQFVVQSDALPTATMEFLRDYRYHFVYTIGPATLVSDRIAEQVRARDFPPDTSEPAPAPAPAPAPSPTPDDGFRQPKVTFDDGSDRYCYWDRSNGEVEVIWWYDISGGQNWTLQQADNPDMDTWLSNIQEARYRRTFYVDPSTWPAQGSYAKIGTDSVTVRRPGGGRVSVPAPSYDYPLGSCDGFVGS